MEPQPPPPASITAWEDKERAGWMAREKRRWHLLRLEAENPSATADILYALMKDVRVAWGSDTTAERSCPDLVVEAILAHPNTPPELLLKLINEGFAGRNPPLRFFAAALCRNPLAPFVSLEVPNFWERVKPTMCQHMLSEADLSHSVLSQFAQHSHGSVTESARLHIAAKEVLLQAAQQDDTAIEENRFALACYKMQPHFDLELLHDWGEDSTWVNRFKSALHLPANEDAFTCDKWSRSPLDLLHYLARDGNRLVRWAAQTRLADPNFVFTWHEGD